MTHVATMPMIEPRVSGNVRPSCRPGSRMAVKVLQIRQPADARNLMIHDAPYGISLAVSQRPPEPLRARSGGRYQEILAARHPKTVWPAYEVPLVEHVRRHMPGVRESGLAGHRHHFRRGEEADERRPRRPRAVRIASSSSTARLPKHIKNSLSRTKEWFYPVTTHLHPAPTSIPATPEPTSISPVTHTN